MAERDPNDIFVPHEFARREARLACKQNFADVAHHELEGGSAGRWYTPRKN
jgi:hypothetical protein